MTYYRKLDHDELGMHLMQKHYDGSFNVLSAITVEGEFDTSRLRNIMGGFIDVMPQLLSTIDDEGQSFIELPAPHEWNMQEYRHDEMTLSEAFEKELNTGLKAEGEHLWRLSIFTDEDAKQSTLLFYFHHSIIDLYSVNRFFNEFLQAYADNCIDKEKLSLANGFPKPITDFLPKKNTGLRGLLTTLAYIFKVTRLTEFRKLTYKEASFNCSESSAKAYTLTIPPEVFTRFKTAAKKHGASLHGALCAAELYALKVLFDENEPVFGFLSSVNTRARLPEEALLGLCPRVGHSIQSTKIAKLDDFWKIAKDSGLAVRKDLEKGHDMAGGSILVPHIKGLIKHNKPSEPKWSLQIANGGELPIKAQYKDLKIVNVRYAQNFKSASNMLGSIITSLNGELTNTICFSAPQFSEMDIQVFADKFTDIIGEVS